MALRSRMFLALTATLAIGLASPSHASRLFKCTDASGNTVYQQNSCDAEAVQEERTFVRDEPPAPVEDVYAEVDGTDYDDSNAELQVLADDPYAAHSPPPQSRTTGVYRDRFGTVIDNRSAAAEELRRAQSRSDSRDGRRINRELYGTNLPEAGDVLPESGLPRGPRYTPPPTPPQTQTATQVGPRVVTDQYGNRYEGAQGSHFVTDPRIGKQCLAVGNTINCNL